MPKQSGLHVQLAVLFTACSQSKKKEGIVDCDTLFLLEDIIPGNWWPEVTCMVPNLASSLSIISLRNAKKEKILLQSFKVGEKQTNGDG